MQQKVAAFRTSSKLRRCGKCGGLLASTPRHVSTAVNNNARVISCGMCGQRHPADAECNVADWLRQKALRARAKQQADLPELPLPYGDLTKRPVWVGRARAKQQADLPEQLPLPYGDLTKRAVGGGR